MEFCCCAARAALVILTIALLHGPIPAFCYFQRFNATALAASAMYPAPKRAAASIRSSLLGPELHRLLNMRVPFCPALSPTAWWQGCQPV